jgi:hypothetical protein
MSSYQEYEHDFAILRLPRSRGRPRKEPRPQHDVGTPELSMKRLLGETTEALDLCLERGIITAEQHGCGVHLRWLYTLRHGAPSVRAVDPTHLGGIDNKQDDPQWRSAREQEFHDAMAKLTPGGYATVLLNICIYNERPRFLSLHRTVSIKRMKETQQLIESLRDGLDILGKMWGRQSPKQQ